MYRPGLGPGVVIHDFVFISITVDLWFAMATVSRKERELKEYFDAILERYLSFLILNLHLTGH